MKRFGILIMILMAAIVFSYSALAVTAAGLDVKINPSSPTVNPGDSTTYTLTVTNNAGHDMSSVSFNSSDLTLVSGTSKINKPVIDPIASLAAGETKTRNFNITILPGQIGGTYISDLNGVEAYETLSPSNSGISGIYGIIVKSLASISVPGSITINTQTGNDDQTYDLIVTNNGNVPFIIKSVSPNPLILTDSDDNEINIVPSFSSSSIAAGSTGKVTLSVSTDTRFKSTSKSGTLTIITDSAGSADVTVNVKVKPFACVNGEQGDIKVSIDEPSTSDEFEPGDKIPVTVSVDNNGDDSISAVVKAELYDADDGKKVGSVYTSSTKTISDGDDYDFDFDIKLDDSFDTSHDLRLYIKAYDKSDEENYCGEDDQSISTTEVEDKVLIRSFTLSPVSAQCGSLADAIVDLKNVGTNDETVSLNFQNTQLGLYQSSQTVSLGTDSDDKQQTVMTSFKIPSNAKEGIYTITATASYAGNTQSAQQTLQVYCPSSSQTTSTTAVSTNTMPTTGAVTYSQKGVTDYFDFNKGVPMSVWVLVDLLLVAGIITLLVVIFRRK